MIKRLLLFCVLFSTTAYSQYYSKYSVQLLKADTIDVHLGTRLQIAADTTVFQGIVGFGASTMSLASDSSVIFDVGVRIRGSHGLKIDGVLRAGSGIFDTALDTTYTNAVSNVTSLNTFLGVTTAGKTKRLTVDTTKYATSSVSGFLKFSDWVTFNAKQPAIGFPLRTDSGGTGLSSYTAGDLLYYASGTAFTKLGIGLSGRWLGSSGTAPQWNAPAALTKTDDTNVTLTLGGSPTTALLNAASITAGWTGQLGISRGGTGQATAVAAFDALAPTTTTGDLIYFDGADNVRRAVGSANDVLQTIGGVPAWVTNPTFGNITTGTLTSGLINGQTISSAANFTGTVTASGTIQTSSGNVSSLTTHSRLTFRQLRFAQFVGDETNAGVIDYGTFDATALSIVGRGTTSNRLVRIYEHLGIATNPTTSFSLRTVGAVEVGGNLTVTGTGTFGSTILGTQQGAEGLRLSRNTDNTGGAGIVGRKSRGSLGSPTAISANDVLFQLRTEAYVNGAYRDQAQYTIESVATIGSTFTPSQHRWWTTNNAGDSGERLVLTSEGNLGLAAGTVNTNANVPAGSFYFTIHGTATGDDGAVRFGNNADGTWWTVGSDGGNSDRFAIASTGVLGSNDRFWITPAGDVNVAPGMVTIGVAAADLVNTEGLRFGSIVESQQGIEWLGSDFSSGYGYRLRTADVGVRSTVQLYLEVRNASASWTKFAEFDASNNQAIWANTGVTSFAGSLTVTGDARVNGGDLLSSATTFNLLTATVTTGNLFGAATTVSIGAGTGTTTVNNDLAIGDQISSINAVTTEGNFGVPVIVDTALANASLASIAATNFTGTTATGLYRISIWLEVTTSVPASTVFATLHWESNDGANLTENTATLDGSGIDNYLYKVFFINHTGAGSVSIQYSTTNSSPSVEYNLRATAERLN